MVQFYYWCDFFVGSSSRRGCGRRGSARERDEDVEDLDVEDELHFQHVVGICAKGAESPHGKAKR